MKNESLVKKKKIAKELTSIKINLLNSPLFNFTTENLAVIISQSR